MATTSTPPFSARITELLRTEHRVSQTKLGSLGPKDLADLRSVASGRSLPDQRVKALALLAATGAPGATSTSVATVLRAALADRSASAEVRAAGATWLSRSQAKGADTALLACLAVEEEASVAHKIVAGLARSGGATAAKRLLALADKLPAAVGAGVGDGVRAHAAFAAAVLACRFGLKGPLPALVPASAHLPAPAAPAEAVAVAVNSASAAQPEDALRVVEQTLADSFGVAGTHDSVYFLTCGGRRLALVAGARLRGPLADLLARPSVLGYVAELAEADGSSSVSTLVLAWPDGAGGLHLSVNRVSGRAEYAGQASVDGDALVLQLDAVVGPGATETSISGSVRGGRLDGLQVRTGQRSARQMPTAVD